MKTSPTSQHLLQAARFAEKLAVGQAEKPMERRVFLKLSGVGGLALGWACASDKPDPMAMDSTPPGMTVDPLEPETPAVEPPEPAAEEPSAPPAIQYDINAYVRVGSDESVTLYVGQSEMGQGVLTALPMLIAEELDVDWAKVRSEHPIASQAKYGNQFTVGSASVANAFMALRQVGAATRQMLLGAAAQRLGVPVGELRTELGVVYHDGSERSATYGELAELAATLPAPQNAPLKSDAQFRIIGTPRRSSRSRAPPRTFRTPWPTGASPGATRGCRCPCLPGVPSALPTTASWSSRSSTSSPRSDRKIRWSFGCACFRRAPTPSRRAGPPRSRTSPSARAGPRRPPPGARGASPLLAPALLARSQE